MWLCRPVVGGKSRHWEWMLLEMFPRSFCYSSSNPDLTRPVRLCMSAVFGLDVVLEELCISLGNLVDPWVWRTDGNFPALTPRKGWKGCMNSRANYVINFGMIIFFWWVMALKRYPQHDQTCAVQVGWCWYLDRWPSQVVRREYSSRRVCQEYVTPPHHHHIFDLFWHS